YQLAVEQKDVALLGLTEAQRAVRYGVEHRLHVGLRLADHLENVASGRLLLERHPQFAVAGLQFLEQPRGLNGDDRLVGEGLQKSDLLVRERTNFGAWEPYRADRDAFTQQGNADVATKAEL